MITIVNFGMGNLGSIRNMLRRLGVESIVTCDASEVTKAERIILPGVGSFDQAMNKLSDLNLIEILNERVLKYKTPVLGICLGMQILTRNSEEGALPGLGWIDAQTIKFRFDNEHNNLKIPHMGWNTMEVKKGCLLLDNMLEDSRFYFAHSYYAVCNRKEQIAATTNYGYDFVSVFQQDNIMGVQFHPEKSHKFGMKILKNFTEFKC